MKLHLVDGTYELFRMYYGAPERSAPDGTEVGATLAFIGTLLGLVGDEGATHVACAFDTRIESFRNDLFDGYKTGDGIDPLLWNQFPLVEEACKAMGMVCWSMLDFEADDALAAGAARWRDEDQVEQICLCSPDKDLAQCVRGDRVVLVDRRRRKTTDEAGVEEKFGVPPRLIPDYLALVGDAADGIPGVPRWGAKSTAAVLSHFGGLEAIPDDVDAWDLKVRGAAGLAENLAGMRDEAALYKTLAILREDVPLEESLDDLEWRGADRDALQALLARLGDESLLDRVPRWRD
jgi:5'-3' exonuclease